MIPYEELCAALSRWRTKQGLPPTYMPGQRWSHSPLTVEALEPELLEEAVALVTPPSPSFDDEPALDPAEAIPEAEIYAAEPAIEELLPLPEDFAEEYVLEEAGQEAAPFEDAADASYTPLMEGEATRIAPMRLVGSSRAPM